MFPAVPKSVRFPEQEETILEFWKEKEIYAETLRQRSNCPRFVFYEGPPTANGLPHPGHCLTRAIKDLFPRYKTMRGYLCERKAGWDTHGLPVEVEVCKELGIHAKEEIEAYGVEPFIQKCQKSVWRYMQDWERLTERLGFWVDLKTAYVTYHQSYVESVWWSLQQLFDRGLLYQGHKIVWWWAQGGTALSAGEVGQGYREVADPSVYVEFPLVDEPQTALVVWTTTPWTLPSNQFAAVHPELTYARVTEKGSDRQWIMAKALVASIAEKTKRTFEVVSILSGSELIGRRYLPPFDFYYAQQGEDQGSLKNGAREHEAWRVVAADFVTTESGSGIVHQAPAFGEVDYDLLREQQARFRDEDGPRLICAVGPDGKFTKEAPAYEGCWVKDADRDIIRDLKSDHRLFHQEQYLHDYPFCWRADQDPLIQYPRESWFVRTTEFKDRLLENNQAIHWLPEHIRDGRFGNFLESNVDWALSRERYWGTPLPIWQCEQSGYQEAIGSYEELVAKPGITGQEVWDKAKRANPELPDDLRVHKPYIDAVTYDSPKVSGARMRRVSEVIDCWYDSGAMPFAQWGFPHQNVESFAEQFPADFISEAIDQTRGWFYSLLAISTLVFDKESLASAKLPIEPVDVPHPFRNCIVLGLMLSEWYESKEGDIYLTAEEARAASTKVRQVTGKMSKSKRNYREPSQIFDRYGADALRWYFFANQAPWTSIRYSERTIKESIPEFLLRLWNVYSFFVIYANIDGFDPSAELEGRVGDLNADVLGSAATYRDYESRGELDRWILSELRRTTVSVVAKMDNYDNYAAAGELNAFVDALSNWYVRRSRNRFWSSDKQSAEKRDAYWTLYECLLTCCKLIAPFTPFLAETLWQTLAGVFQNRATLSVHLCDYPGAAEGSFDERLLKRMRLAREISSLGRAARMNAKLKVRQPLQRVEVVLSDGSERDWLVSHAALIAKELNVLEVDITEDAHDYITYEVKPNFKLLGPLLGKDMPAVKKKLGAADGGRLLAELESAGVIRLTLEHGGVVELDREKIDVDIRAKEGWAAAQGKGCVVVLATELTPELIRRGIAKDVVRFVQDIRKELDLDYTDRVAVSVFTGDDGIRVAVNDFLEFIKGETLCSTFEFQDAETEGGREVDLSGARALVYVKKVS